MLLKVSLGGCCDDLTTMRRSLLMLPKLGHQAIIYEVVQIRQELYFAGVGRNTAPLPVLPDVDVAAAGEGGGRQLTLIVVAVLLHLPKPTPTCQKSHSGKRSWILLAK